MTTLQLRLLVALAGGTPDDLLNAWHARRPTNAERPEDGDGATIASAVAEEALLSLQASGMARAGTDGPVITPGLRGAVDVYVRPRASFDLYQGPVGSRPANATVRFGEWGASSVSESAPGVLTFMCCTDPDQVINAVLLPVVAAVVSSMPLSTHGSAAAESPIEITPDQVVSAIGEPRSLVRCVAQSDGDRHQELLWLRGSTAQFLYRHEEQNGSETEMALVSVSDDEVVAALRDLAFLSAGLATS